MFQRFEQNEGRIAEQKDYSMVELQLGDEAVQKESKDPMKDVFQQKSQQDKANKKSKKQAKLEQQIKIFDLKMMAKRPYMVEAWAITAKDPLFLVTLK